MSEQICPRCGVDLTEFEFEPCSQCTYQYDPLEPDSEQELNFEDPYIEEPYELEDFADVYDRVHMDYDDEEL